MRKILFKELKKTINETLKANDYKCSISIADTDTTLTSFANLRGIKVSWGRTEMAFFVPGEISFIIPYAYIHQMHRYSVKQVTLVVEKRQLVSIRETKEIRSRA